MTRPFLLLLSLLVSQTCLAEVWRCNGVYTDKKVAGQACSAVEGSKTCGNAGNKFFSPKKMSGSTELPCPVSGEHTSPFVDLKTSETLKSDAENSYAKAKEKQQKFDNSMKGMSAGKSSGNNEESSIEKDIQSLGGQQKIIQDTFGKLSEALSGK